MQTKLTAALVRQHTEDEPPVRDVSFFDTVVPRLALRVKPPPKPGARWAATYFVRYTVQQRERRIKVGDPRTMSLDEARKAARTMLARVDSGGDPVGDLAKARADWTIAQAWEAYAASPEFKRKAERSQIEDARTFQNHILRQLGTTRLADIDVPIVLRMKRAVTTDTRKNTRKRKLGGPGAARKATRMLSSLLSWSVNEGSLSRNPIIGAVRLDGDRERTTVLDTPEQYATLFATMDEMVAAGDLRPSVRAFVVLLAATGMRRNEARTLRWEDVDLGRRRVIIRLPKGSKLARTGTDTETVSMPPIAAAALAAIRPEDALPGDPVFPPARGRLFSVNRDFVAIREKAKLPAGMVLHSLRHSIGTAGILAGMSTLEVSKMLRHRNVSVTQRYVHLAEASAGRLTDRAFAHLNPAEPEAAASVHQIPTGSRNGR